MYFVLTRSCLIWNFSSFLLNWRTCYKWKSSLRCPSLPLSSVSRCLIFSGMARMINKTSLIWGALSSAGVRWVIPCDSVSLIGLIGPLNVGWGWGAEYTCEKISHTSKIYLNVTTVIEQWRHEMGRGCNMAEDAEVEQELNHAAERRAAPCHLKGTKRIKRNTARVGVMPSSGALVW